MIIDYIVSGIYLEMLEKGLITSMMINKSNNWLAWFLDFDVNYSERKERLFMYVEFGIKQLMKRVTIYVFIRII